MNNEKQYKAVFNSKLSDYLISKGNDRVERHFYENGYEADIFEDTVQLRSDMMEYNKYNMTKLKLFSVKDLIEHMEKVKKVYATYDYDFTYDGKTFATDVGYAFDGIDVFLDTLFRERDIDVPDDIAVKWEKPKSDDDSFNYDYYNLHNGPLHFLIKGGMIEEMAYHPMDKNEYVDNVKEEDRQSPYDQMIDYLMSQYMILERNRNDGNDKNVTNAQNTIISKVAELDEKSARILRKLSESKGYIDEDGLIRVRNIKLPTNDSKFVPKSLKIY